MAAGFEQQDYKGATNTVLGFSWLLSWLQGPRGFSWQTAEADNLRFHPHLRTFAVWQFCFHIITLLIFKRQDKQYQGYLEVSFLPYLSILFCPSSARSQPLCRFVSVSPSMFRFPVVALFEVVDAAFSVNYLPAI